MDRLHLLVKAAASGDDAAWTRLVARFDPLVRSVARSYRLAPSDVDDVAQATWLRLFRHIGTLRDAAAIGGWLKTVARREALRHLQAPVREIPSDDPLLGEKDLSDGPELGVLAAERRAVLARALATLPERHRRLMTLLAAEPQPGYREISAELAIPVGSIGPIRARSLERLGRHAELCGLHAA